MFLALGVTQDEDPLPLVRCTDLRCGYNLPLRIEPEVGQSSQESSDSIPGKKASDILHDREAGFHFANDS
jgi:hypothetical protein